MYFSIKILKKNQIWFSYIISYPKYLQAIQKAFFYKKNVSEMFKRNLLMLLYLQVARYQNKNESWVEIYCWKVGILQTLSQNLRLQDTVSFFLN